MIRIALVEDEAEVRAQLQGYVQRHTRQYGTEFAVTEFADGMELQNRDGAFGVNKDGKFFVWIRYDLPESMNSLVLVPNGSGIAYKAKIAAGETPTHENEDIVLLK